MIRLEERLGVRRAIQNDQLFWFGSFLVLFANPGETWPVPAGIVACHDEQGGGLELVSRVVRRRTEQYQAIDLTRPRSDRCIASSPASHAAPDYRHALRTRFSQIADSSQDIQVKRRIHRVGLARASRFTVAAEVERQHSKFCRRERSSLLLPALLVERTTVGQHNSSVAFSVNISVDTPPSWVGKDTVFWAAAPESNNATMTGMSLRTLKMYHHSEVEPCDAYCSVWLDEPEPV